MTSTIQEVMVATSPYDVLKVDRSANDETIRRAYRQLALQLHPDKNDSPLAHEAFQRVGRAYGVLKDPKKRRIFDQRGESAVKDYEDRGEREYPPIATIIRGIALWAGKRWSRPGGQVLSLEAHGKVLLIYLVLSLCVLVGINFEMSSRKAQFSLSTADAQHGYTNAHVTSKMRVNFFTRSVNQVVSDTVVEDRFREYQKWRCPYHAKIMRAAHERGVKAPSLGECRSRKRSSRHNS